MSLSLVVAALLAAAPAPSNPDLRAADAAWKNGEWEKVVPLTKKALTAELPLNDQRHAWELAALAHAAFGRSKEAVEAFRHLVAVDPAWKPDPMTSPKVKSYFAEAWMLGPLGAPRPAAPDQKVASSRKEAWAPSADAARDPEPAPTAKAIYKQWWFWVGVGAVTAAAAGGTAYALSRPIIPEGSLGTGALRR